MKNHENCFIVASCVSICWGENKKKNYCREGNHYR